MLAAVNHRKRHNNVRKIIHIDLLDKKRILKTNETYYEFTPQHMIENAIHKI